MNKNLFLCAAMAAAVWFTGCNKDDDPSAEDYFQVHFDVNGAKESAALKDTTMVAGKSYTVPVHLNTEWLCLGIGHKNADGSFDLLPGKMKSNSTFNYEFTFKPKNYAIKEDTLYLVWDYKKITITYHANGASGNVPQPITIDAHKYQEGYTPKSLPDTIVLDNGENLKFQDGYYFIGWNTKADGSGTFLPKGFKYVNPSSVDLYAMFENHNGHEYVDLGLPSGTLWAKTNIGTTCEAKEGDLFAYGETTPKSEYTFENWKLLDDKVDHWFHLMIDTYQGYGWQRLKLMYMQDAASTNWGHLWRTPSIEEWQELFENCTVEDYEYVLIEEGKTLRSKILRSKNNSNYLIIPNTEFSANHNKNTVRSLENNGYFTKATLSFLESETLEKSRPIWQAFFGAEWIARYWDGVCVRPVTSLQ